MHQFSHCFATELKTSFLKLTMDPPVPGSATAAAQSKSTAESAATRAETAAKRAEDIASAVALEDASTTKKGIV
ncbi:hypothetical protein, partial [Pseudomonas aeruginosa]|uniref:hypothetical protein n=1 Tax=Pseudomonas aeruginosa TaxID=287 RepID=UPI003CFB5D35